MFLLVYRILMFFSLPSNFTTSLGAYATIAKKRFRFVSSFVVLITFFAFEYPLFCTLLLGIYPKLVYFICKRGGHFLNRCLNNLFISLIFC